MLDPSKFLQYGFPRELEDIKGITLHETGNYDMDAHQLFDYLNDVNKTSNGCHYICDANNTIQCMPDDYAVYHTGMGKDWGNRYTIAIEIVSSFNDEEYRKAEDRAISLVYDLQKKYKIPMNMIFFHNDWDSRAHCPNRAINEYGTSKNYVYQRIEKE